jgi:hypothetical protein
MKRIGTAVKSIGMTPIFVVLLCVVIGSAVSSIYTARMLQYL